MIGVRKLALGAVAALALPMSALAAGVQPGQWQIAVTINSADMPGAPPAVARMMVGRTTTIKQCITPENAARGPQDMLKSDKSCVFDRYSMVGGKLSSSMTCTRHGSTVKAVSTGTFSPTSFTSSGRSTFIGGQTPMTMTSTVVGKRIGDCGK